jgi:hypothetical protein
MTIFSFGSGHDVPPSVHTSASNRHEIRGAVNLPNRCDRECAYDGGTITFHQSQAAKYARVRHES